MNSIPGFAMYFRVNLSVHFLEYCNESNMVLLSYKLTLNFSGNRSSVLFIEFLFSALLSQ